MTFEEVIAQRVKQCKSLQELSFVLQKLFEQHSIWTDGQLISIRQLVGYIGGLRIEIFHTEHPPPHFHVKAADVDASFTIEDCTFLKGSIGSRERDLVKWWYKHSRATLITIW